MKAAQLDNGSVANLVLLEPNPFYLLDRFGRNDAYQEALTLRACIKENGAMQNWNAAAEVFANYWTGDGSWDAMSEGRREKFASALPPNFHEWDAVMNEETSIEEWAGALPERTTVIQAADTVNSIREIIDLLRVHIPDWTYKTIDSGGHMAPLTKPDAINPLVRAALG